MPQLDIDLAVFPTYKLPASTPITRVEESHSIQGGYTQLSRQIMPFLRTDRPALLVTSTSWTPDEDFSILVDALRRYEVKKRTYDANGRKNLPKVLMFVTGKGPLRAKYINELQRLKNEESWQSVRVISIWLEPEDYPRLLGKS
jgi:beta-1,4-mannosyltransferase